MYCVRITNPAPLLEVIESHGGELDEVGRRLKQPSPMGAKIAWLDYSEEGCHIVDQKGDAATFTREVAHEKATEIKKLVPVGSNMKVSIERVEDR